MGDINETIGNSLIQHGKSSNRVYLMKLAKADYPQIIDQIEDLAETNNYTKIFAKVPAWAKDGFIAKGYIIEAQVPGFYHGREDALFLGKYLDSKRAKSNDAEQIEEIITFTSQMEIAKYHIELAAHYNFTILTEKDAQKLAEIYRKVFKTYPFPIHDPDYLVQTMGENIVYFGIWDNERLVAVSSCEMDEKAKNVEMTDFATLPEYRKQGLAAYLLAQMEAEMKDRGIITAYTIARAISFGMNITFAKQHYQYAGTLINNTDISGGIESMNIWFKPL